MAYSARSLQQFFSLSYIHHPNVGIIYYTFFAKSSWFTLGMWYAFYLHVASPEWIAIVHTTGFIVGIGFDIPSGYLADKFGRKRLLVIGLALFATGIGLFAFIGAVWHMIVLEIITQIGLAAISGAFEAIIYDTSSHIDASQATEVFNTIYAKCRQLESLALLVTGLVGGFIYTISEKLNWLAMSALCVVAFFLCLRIKDFHSANQNPSLATPLVEGKGTLIAHLREGFSVLWNKPTRFLLPGVVVLGGTAFISNWGVFPIASLEQAAFNQRDIAIFFTLTYLLNIAVNHFYPAIYRRLGHFFGFHAYSAVSLALLLLGAWCYHLNRRLVVIPLGLFIVVSVLMLSYFTSVINDLTSDAHRATALSAASLLSKVAYMVGAPAMGLCYAANRADVVFLALAGLVATGALLVQLLGTHQQSKSATIG